VRADGRAAEVYRARSASDRWQDIVELQKGKGTYG
jgi:hypothetical protein